MVGELLEVQLLLIELLAELQKLLLLALADGVVLLGTLTALESISVFVEETNWLAQVKGKEKTPTPSPSSLGVLQEPSPKLKPRMGHRKAILRESHVIVPVPRRVFKHLVSSTRNPIDADRDRRIGGVGRLIVSTYPGPPVLGGAPVAPSVMTRAVVLKAARFAKAMRGFFAMVARNIVKKRSKR
jgi:hypothetical protein